MKSIPSFFLSAVFLTLAVFISPVTGMPTACKPESSTEARLPKTGIRFVFESPNPGIRELYIPVSDKACKSIIPLPGLPSPRIPFPKGGKLVLFAEEPLKNKKNTPEAWGTVPGNVERILCLVTGSRGHFKMMFFNEEELPNNSVLILNRTSRPYLLVFDFPLLGEKKQILIPGGGQYIFGKGTQGSSSREYPAKLMVEYTLKNGNKRWLKDRSFTIYSYDKGSQILLLAPNDDGSAMLFQKILLPRG